MGRCRVQDGAGKSRKALLGLLLTPQNSMSRYHALPESLTGLKDAFLPIGP